jgi:GNAT superfamily N-acetyltransferase
MVELKKLILASLQACRNVMRLRASGKGPRAPALVHIRSLGSHHRKRILRHLLALEAQDRYLRFGYAANEEQICRYVAEMNFERDEVFGIYNRKLELIAMAHLAFLANESYESCAEFGVSVLKKVRGRGFGARLFDRAVMHARNYGVSLLLIQALSENSAMLKIARNAGATVERHGSESEAFLRLPPATLDTFMTEMVEEQLAKTDYRIKLQAKRFWHVLTGVQEVRRGVQEARKKAAM